MPLLTWRNVLGYVWFRVFSKKEHAMNRRDAKESGSIAIGNLLLCVMLGCTVVGYTWATTQ